MALVLIHLLDDGLGNSLHTLGAAVETLNDSLEGVFCELLMRLVDVIVAGERHLHRQHVEELFFTTLIVAGVLDDVDHTVPDDVGDIHSDAFTHKGVAALLVDDGTLLVHHVVVLNQALTDTEVVLFDFLLGALDAT